MLHTFVGYQPEPWAMEAKDRFPSIMPEGTNFFYKSYHLYDSNPLTSAHSSLYPYFEKQEGLTETLDTFHGPKTQLNTGTSSAQTMVGLRRRAL